MNNTSKFTKTEISNLILLGKMLGQTKRFAKTPLNEMGRKHLVAILDTAHKIPAVLLYPDRYDIKDDIEHLRQLLEMIDCSSFIESNIK